MTTLYDSIELGPFSLNNRIVLAPMTRARSGKDRIPNAMMAEYYAQRASAGLIISEATVVSEQGIGWVDSPGIYNDAQTEGWRQVIKAVHDKGGRIFLQLWHCGRASHSSFFDGKMQPVAPSAVKIENEERHTPKGKEESEVPRALELDEIPGIVEDYKQAANKARDAGFDGIEIHAANGYLIDQFLQSKTNHRTDKYGGSIEARYQFLSEIVTAVKEAYPAKQIGVRIAPNGSFNDMGSPDYKEQFMYVAKELDKHKLAYLHVMDGLAFGFHELGEPMTLGDFRKVYSGILMGNCGYSKESAESAVSTGAADMIAIGRPYISNPDLVERFKNNWPLNEIADISTWYSPTGEKGYTDFAPYHS